VAEALLSEAQENLDEARSVLQDHQDMRYAGFVHDAEKEVAMGGFRIEARMTGF
jgi:predicted translin family RNA/ssDNA-binding protein